MRSRDEVADTRDLRREGTRDARGDACRRGRRESPPGILGEVSLVMSGPGRKMYQSLEPKPEGAIYPKRSRPQGVAQLSSRHLCQYGKLAGDEHTRGEPRGSSPPTPPGIRVRTTAVRSG